MSLCTPRSWIDDRDSDISDPESDDRVTIYTNELSPTPSELFTKSVRSLHCRRACWLLFVALPSHMGHTCMHLRG